MSTIKTLFEDSIRYEEHFLAYYIFCLIQEGKITKNDESSVLNKVKPDREKLTTMIKNNTLGFCQIKMYALKGKKGKWMFIFSKSPEEAKWHLWEVMGSQAVHCREISLDHEIMNGNRFISFREWKKEQKAFPCLVGYG